MLAIRLTHHARTKMRDRNVTFEDIAHAIERPEITEPHKGKRRYTRDNLCVVVSEEGGIKVVITILLRDTNQWTDADISNRAN